MKQQNKSRESRGFLLKKNARRYKKTTRKNPLGFYRVFRGKNKAPP